MLSRHSRAQDATLVTIGSKRTSKVPSYLCDYYCENINSSVVYPIFEFLSTNCLSSSHQAFIIEPEKYKQAIFNPKWHEAMMSELRALQSSGTCTIKSLPNDKRDVGCKWVYKVKCHVDGTFERCKARLVAKRYT